MGEVCGYDVLVDIDVGYVGVQSINDICSFCVVNGGQWWFDVIVVVNGLQIVIMDG